jgi:amino acid adenylation domain-containing protein
MWVASKMEPDTSPSYNVPYRLTLRGPLDIDVLRAAFQIIVNRHETLRTTFRFQDGGLFQVIQHHHELELPVVGELLTEEEARRTFDLARGPLFRAWLVRVAELEHHLVLVFHHLIFDLWSMGVFVEELTAAYSALAAGCRPSLPALPVQYADYAQWARDRPVSDQLAYWRERLAGAPHVLRLQADAPGQSAGSRAGVHSVQLPQPLADAVSGLARDEGCTLFTTLLTGFAVLLGAHAGTDDLLIGTPATVRPRAETADLIGLFVNVLAIRADLSGDPTFRDLLHRLRETVLSAQQNQEIPLALVVQELDPERVAGRLPVVQVCFWVQHQQSASRRLGEVELQVAGLRNGTAKFDLILGVRVVDQQVTCDFTYRADRLDAWTIARLAERYLLSLERMTADPDRRVREAPLATEDELRTAHKMWGAGAAAPLPGLTLADLLRAQAERSPDAVAITDGKRSLTYRELHEGSDRLASALPGRGSVVAVSLERSVELVTALVAVLKAGAAYVPVAPGLPGQRARHLIESAGARLLINHTNLDMTGDITKTPPTPDDLAYVIFTSGSTGHPKQVAVPHRAIVNQLLWAQKADPLAPGDRVLQLAPASFDFSVWEMFAPLAFGAQLVIAPPGAEFDPGASIEFAIEQAVTVAFFVPTVLDTILAHPDVTRWTTLRMLLTGGETLGAATRDRALALLPASLINQYGPTETCISVTRWHCERDDDAVPIGRPAANTQLYVLDEHLLPQPPGVPGELVVAGASLAWGYLGAPALTAERFIPDFLGSQPGGRLYRTGDIVRWRADGSLEYLGRADRQVKIRGQRIEPGEIEAQLTAESDVAQAVVVVRERPGLGAVLVAYAVTQVDEEELRTRLRACLPGSMIPAAIVRIEGFPTTAAGKTDLAALPEPEFGADPAAYAALGTSLEQEIAEIWRSVLGVEEVGIYDNFFALGGHSLLMTRIHEQLIKAGYDITLLQMFEHSTVASLAAYLAGKQANRTRTADATVDRQRAGRQRLLTRGR